MARLAVQQAGFQRISVEYNAPKHVLWGKYIADALRFLYRALNWTIFGDEQG